MATKVHVIFYSMYGHVYRMAEAVAAGARELPGTEVALLQVPELVPDEILEKSGAKAARKAFAHVPLARVDQLADADAIIFGTPTRFRQHGGADAELSRPYRRLVGARSFSRKGGQRLHQHGDAARWSRNHDHELP